VSEYAHIGVEERSKPVVLIKPVEQPEERIDRQSGRHPGAAPIPKRLAANPFQPQHEQQEKSSCQQVQARGETGKQIQSEGA
jgi:hypothetical protein